MCIAKPVPENPKLRERQRRDALRKAPSNRVETQTELRSPESQAERQRLGARLGTAQLRSPILNVPA